MTVSLLDFLEGRYTYKNANDNFATIEGHIKFHDGEVNAYENSLTEALQQISKVLVLLIEAEEIKQRHDRRWVTSSDQKDTKVIDGKTRYRHLEELKLKAELVFIHNEAYREYRTYENWKSVIDAHNNTHRPPEPTDLFTITAEELEILGKNHG